VLIVSDVHGAHEALRRVAARGGPLLVLGDLINFIDYRNNDGIIADVAGRDFVEEIVRLRTAGRHAAAGELWRELRENHTRDLRGEFETHAESAYVEVCAALEGVEAYVTYGNVDRPDMLRRMLPPTARFVDGDVVEIEGRTVGFVGGGMASIRAAGEVSEEGIAAKLDALGPVEVLCTHMPPQIEWLARDVIGGYKHSAAVRDYIERHQPAYHFFGDVHQPRALTWRVGATRCHNVGYFRATGRPFRFEQG